MNARLTVLAVAAGLSAFVEAADAKLWIGGSSGNWNDPANWETVSTTASSYDYIFTNEVTFADGDTGSYNIYIYLTNSTSVLHFRGGGTHYARRVYIRNGGALHIWDKGCFDVDHANGEMHCGVNSYIYCHDEHVIPPSLYRFNLTGTLDLGGFDQAFTNLQSFAYDTYGQRLVSETPAMLSIGGPRIASCNFTGYILGMAGLCWNPEDSGKTITFYNYDNSTAGELIVSNGVVNLNSGNSRASFTNLSRAEIGSGATLRIPADQSVKSFFAEHLVLHEGASLFLGETSTIATSTLQRVTFVSAAGVRTELPADVYGASSDYGCFAGNGFIRINPTMSYWSSAADGNWSSAADWTHGVPSATFGAGLAEGGGDYTVTVDEAAVVTNLTVRNFGGGTATLDVPTRLESTKGIWTVDCGGRVTVPAGGEIEYRGFDENVTGKFSRSVKAFTVRGGGSMEICGKVNVTNMCGALHVGSPDASVTSKVVIAGNGELFLGGVDGYSSYWLYPAGRIEVSGNGVLRFLPTVEKYFWCQSGGSLDFSGNAKFDAGGMWDICLGQGQAIFRDDAKLVGDGAVGNGTARLYITAAAGAPTDVRFLDRAAYSAGSSNSQTLLRPSGGRLEMHFDSAATHNMGHLRMGRTAYSGISDIYISDGVVLVDGSGGLNQGGASVYFDADSFSTGHVYQTGGAFVVDGASGSYYASFQFGFILGDGLTSTSERTPTVLGVYNLSGGCVTNKSPYSPFVLGIGRGRGEFIQTGGEFVSLATEPKAPALFGFSNGYGYYVLSNGTATVSSRIWVGGVDPATCSHDHVSYVGTQSVGGITVAAAALTQPCRFTAGNTVVFGGLGEGTLEMGPGGTFAGTDLVLSNNTASAIRFRVTDSGSGLVDLSGKLSVTDGASLVIDATEFTGKNVKRCQLVRYASKEGDFAEGKVSILSDTPDLYRLSVTDAGMRFSRVTGTAIYIR